MLLNGVQPPALPATTAASENNGPNAVEIKLEPQRLRAGVDGTLVVDVALPPGYHLNPSAPQRYRVTLEKGSQALTIDNGIMARSAKDLRLPLRLPVRAATVGPAEIRFQLTLFYCREDNTGTCRIKTLVWLAPVEVTTDANASGDLKIDGKVGAE